MPADPEQPKRKRLILPNLESAIDKQIREAMERGDFDNLRGQGKPLNLERDPGVPEDMELAFNLLKNAGFAPAWIETRKEMEAAKEKLFAPLRRFVAGPPFHRRERAQLQAKLVEQFRAGAAELNRQIDTFNLNAPTPQVHLRRIRIDSEIEKFLAESNK